MKVLGLVGGVRVYMVMFEAHKCDQYHRNRLGTTHYAPAAIGAATTAGPTFVLLVFASVVITKQIDIGDEATRVSFLPFMILSCTGLGKATISGLSRSSTVPTALHTRLAAFYAEMVLILVCQFYLRNEGFWSRWRCSGVYGCV